MSILSLISIKDVATMWALLHILMLIAIDCETDRARKKNRSNFCGTR